MIYEPEKETCNIFKVSEGFHKEIAFNNVSIGRFPNDKIFCFLAEASISSLTMKIWGNFSPGISLLSDVD